MIYKIKEGSHKQIRFPKILWNKRAITLTFRFDSSAIYTTQDLSNQLDWNKLMGYSRGYHQMNSIRLGWRWNPKTLKIELGKYSYQDGNRLMMKIDEISVGETKSIKLEFDKGCKVGYMLYPYFGGNETAPHDIQIEIEHGFN